MAEVTSEDAVRLIVGVIAIVFTIYMVVFRRAAAGMPPHAGKGFFWGGCAGYTSYVAHAGSPPLQVYLLPQRLPKVEYAATAVLFFAGRKSHQDPALLPDRAIGLRKPRNSA